MSYDALIGLPLEKAKECLKNERYEVIDFSSPDKFHRDTKATLRVVKIKVDGVLKIYAAGFVDKIEGK